MPQFLTGESKTPKVTMRNPTGKSFDYNGFIYLGRDLAIVSEKASSLGAGEEKQITFPPVTMPQVIGTYPVHIGVFSAGQNIALYKAIEDVTIVAPEITLHYSNPRILAVLWDASVYDIALRNWAPASPSGIKEIADPPRYGGQPNVCTYSLTGKTFLLWTTEVTYGMTWVMLYGPFLVTVPKLGEYTWNSQDGKIDGISTIELPLTNNRSLVTGILTLGGKQILGRATL